MSDNADLRSHIEDLIAEEHQLRDDPHKTPEGTKRLREIEVQLDRYWDLLRQRRARREFDQDPKDAKIRSGSEVEGYLD